MICPLIKCDKSPSKPAEPEPDYGSYLREFGGVGEGGEGQKG